MNWIEGARTTEPAPQADAGVARPPDVVSFDDHLAAIAPVLALVGMTKDSIFAPGFSVDAKSIKFISVTPIPGVDPIPVGDEPHAEWGWPVEVMVDRP